MRRGSIIDPSLYQLQDGTWRLWYKDERDHSHIHYADSKDLSGWTQKGVAVSDRSGEAPKVFRWRGSYWMITDVWKGLGVYKSDDLEHWTVQPNNLLQAPGTLPTDRSEGHHCDVIVHGYSAYIYYFTHQRDADTDPALAHSREHTVLQVTELHEKDGVLTTDRDSSVHVDLGRP
jgi:hypothetical protein